MSQNEITILLTFPARVPHILSLLGPLVQRPKDTHKECTIKTSLVPQLAASWVEQKLAKKEYQIVKFSQIGGAWERGQYNVAFRVSNQSNMASFNVQDLPPCTAGKAPEIEGRSRPV